MPKMMRAVEIPQPGADFKTFPLGDSKGTMLTGDCSVGTSV